MRTVIIAAAAIAAFVLLLPLSAAASEWPGDYGWRGEYGYGVRPYHRVRPPLPPARVPRVYRPPVIRPHRRPSNGGYY